MSITLEQLKNEGKKVAFVEGNRSLDKKNIKSKVASIKEYGENLVPIIYVQGSKAVADGCKLKDADTYKDIDNAENYIVIIDGQHRYKAMKELAIPEANFRMEQCTSEDDTRKLLAEMNKVSIAWSGADFSKGAYLMHPDNEFLKVVADFVDKGFTTSTISKFLFFGNGYLTKAKLAKMFVGEVNPDESLDIQRGLDIYNAAKEHFDDKFLAKRYFIDGVIKICNKIGSNNYLLVVKAINQFNKEIIKEIKASDDKTLSVFNVLNSLLND